MGKKRILLLLLTLWNAVFLTQCTRLADHTLYANDQWRVGKRMMVMYAMASDEYLLSRASLIFNKLHLSRFFGYQEVFYKTPLQWNELSFTASFAADAALTVILSKTPEESLYLRLSRNPELPSQLFKKNTTDFSDEILFTFPELNLSNNKILIQKSENKFQLTIDEKSYVTPRVVAKPGLVGWIGDAPKKKILIDDVSIKTGDSEIVDDFSPRSSFIICFAMIFAALGLAFGLFHFFFLSGALKSALLMASILPFVFCTDYFFWRNLEIEPFTRRLESSVNEHIANLIKPVLGLEKHRYRFFESLNLVRPVSHKRLKRIGYTEPTIVNGPWLCKGTCEKTNPQDVKNAFSTKEKNTYRVLFIGTSQTFGTGASLMKNTFVGIVYDELKKKYPKLNIELLNISMCGLRSHEMFALYESSYSWFEPDRIVINLSGNDQGNDRFERLVRDFVEKHPQSVLMAEPLSTQEKFIANYEILKGISREKRIPLLEITGFLKKNNYYNDPLFWWDFIHFTDYGHYVVGHWLSQQNVWISDQ